MYLIKSPGNQVVEKEAAVKLATDRAIHLYQDPEFSMETRVFINKITRSPLQFYDVIVLFFRLDLDVWLKVGLLQTSYFRNIDECVMPDICYKESL